MKNQIIQLAAMFAVGASLLSTRSVSEAKIGAARTESDPFIGKVMMFGGNFAPRGWARCEGQLLPIVQHQALFSILGTTYGGDGRSTFALPDLRGRVVLGGGNGPGLTPRQLGSKGPGDAQAVSPQSLPTPPQGRQPASPQPEGARVAADGPTPRDHILRLRSDDGGEREQAVEALAEMGAAAEPLLLSAQSEAQGLDDLSLAIRLWSNAQAARLKIRANIRMLQSENKIEQQRAIESLVKSGQDAEPLLLGAQKQAQEMMDLTSAVRLWGNAQAAMVRIRADNRVRAAAVEAAEEAREAARRSAEEARAALARQASEAGSHVTLSFCIALEGSFPSRN